MARCVPNTRGSTTVTDTIDWKLLRDKAIQAAHGAYAPYSRFPVGAAALLRRNLAIYGLGGIVVPFAGIKIIDVLITAVHLA